MGAIPAVANVGNEALAVDYVMIEGFEIDVDVKRDYQKLSFQLMSSIPVLRAEKEKLQECIQTRLAEEVTSFDI